MSLGDYLPPNAVRNKYRNTDRIVIRKEKTILEMHGNNSPIKVCKCTYKGRNIQRVSKRMIRFQKIISYNENVLQLQNKLQTIQ